MSAEELRNTNDVNKVVQSIIKEFTGIWYRKKVLRCPECAKDPDHYKHNKEANK